MHIEVALHPEAALSFLGPDDEYIRALEESEGVLITLRAVPDGHLEMSSVRINTEELQPKIPHWNENEILHLLPDAPLFPHKDARFAVVENTLLHFQHNTTDGAPVPHSRRPATLQILQSNKPGNGRWYFETKVLTYYEVPAHGES